MREGVGLFPTPLRASEIESFGYFSLMTWRLCAGACGGPDLDLQPASRGARTYSPRSPGPRRLFPVGGWRGLSVQFGRAAPRRPF
jgi:hypothetical protein